MSIKSALESILAEIEHRSEGRPVTIVAVSKRQSVAAMKEYHAIASAIDVKIAFGENYVQELAKKKELLKGEIEWHLTGPLQSNKVLEAVRLSDVIESVHSAKIIEGIARAARKLGKKQKILLQINIGNDPDKRGFAIHEIRDAITLTHQFADDLILCGLMTITPLYDDEACILDDYQKMAKLRETLITEGLADVFADGVIQLSMGMSADYPLALAAGADFIRIGTFIFGTRSPKSIS